MIFSPNRFAFIHLPRTGGHSIMQAVGASPNGTTGTQICGSVWPQPFWLHGRAADLAPLMPGWSKSFRWGVTRNPWDVLESEWSFWSGQRAKLEATNGTCRAGNWLDDLFWNRAVEAGQLGFEGWAKVQYEMIPSGGGRWRWWCCADDGADLGIEPILYRDLPARWGELCHRMGIAPVPLPRSNSFGRAEGINWTPAVDEFVCTHFADDIARFGFQRPPSVEESLGG